jgi:uncharacterized protein (TIGR01244 family)
MEDRDNMSSTIQRWIWFATTTVLALGVASCSTSSLATTSSDSTPQNARTASEESTEGADSNEARWHDLDVSNLDQPFEGIVTAGQPSASQLEQLAEAGIETVVNLRTPAEATEFDERQAVRSAGMTYVSIPIGGPEDLTKKKAHTLAEVLDSSRRPVLVHCGSSNRVGALFALKAHWVDGLAPDRAMAIGDKAGLGSLRDAVRERLDA